MGAGEPSCPEEAKAQLLRQVVDLNIGFSEAQLCCAIDHLVKEIGSLGDALAWIPRDNFTLLVNYILDSNVDSDCQQLHSPSSCQNTRKMENQPRPNALEADTRSEDRKKGGDHSTKGGIKRLTNGCQVVMSGGSIPVEMDQSSSKNERQNDTSLSKRGVVDRNELRKHYKKKLCTDIVKVPDRAVTLQVDNARVLATSNPGKPSDHFNSSQKASNPEHKVQNEVHLERTNLGVKFEDQKTKKRRESESVSSMHKSSFFLKNGKFTEPTTTKELLWEARTSIPSGCHDLATHPESPRVVKNNVFSQRQNPKEGHTDRSLVETVAQQSKGRTSSQVCTDLVEAKEIPSMLRGLKSMHRGDKMRERETGTPILLSNNDGQKASCSVPDGFPVKGEQDLAPYGADTVLLIQLEAILKEGNCQRALEVVEAWKEKQQQAENWHVERNHLEGRGYEVVAEIPGKKRGFVVSCDISRGLEKFAISCVNEYNTEVLPENFLYITRSAIRQAAHVDASFIRIGDLHCCCSDDCLRSSEACKCTDSTRGEYAYDKNGRLIERLASSFQSGCTTINGDFVTECCDKCRCSMNCGNRIVQRGITRKLQVFMTPTKKGWGVRTLENIPARSFLFEYIGEIATNLEQFFRNKEYAKSGVHTYTMNLDADLDMEKRHFKEGLNDNEALVLDATIFGNVSRFVNHRCNDANLFLRPVQIETRDTHYYHAALFAARDIQEMEELTWDYGIDFQDRSHSVKAFKCHCKSSLCRDKESAFNKEKLRKGKVVKSSHLKLKGVQQGRQ